MHAALRLALAIARAKNELRARMGGGRRPKKMKKLGRPAKTGGGTACGTGKGGFQSGNVCALEDGIPDKPKTFAQGGALKKANPKADREKAKQLKAKEDAAAAAKARQKKLEKMKAIGAKKKEAAGRKAQKDAKAAADSKAAADAAAAKKKAMLQKLRITKANKQVEVVGTPKSVAEQIKEAKTSLASKKLIVAKTPKSIKQEIEDIKAAKEAEAKAKAEASAKAAYEKAKAESAAAEKAAAEIAAKRAAEKGKPTPVKKVDDPEELAPKKPFSTPTPSELTTVKTLGGSTGAVLAEKDGQKFVVKAGKTAGHIANESQADELYVAAGVSVPRQQLHTDANGVQKKVAEFVNGKTLAELKVQDKAKFDAAVEKVKKDFVVDALLGNYDVVGMNLDNIVVKGGKVYRVDNGGSLTFRAQGKPKTLDSDVTELETLRNASINPAAAGVFGSLTNKEISAQITRVLKRRDAILAAAKAEKLRETLKKRLDSLFEWQKNYKKSLKATAQPQPGYAAANGKGLEAALSHVKSSSANKPEVIKAVSSGVTRSTMSEDDRDLAVSALWNNSLTNPERSALTNWGGSGYVNILSIEKKGPQAIQASQLVRNFRKAAAKLPRYHGTITRRLDGINEQQIKDWLKTGRWSTEHPKHAGNPTHASFSTIDKAAAIEKDIKAGMSSPGKGSVIVVARNSTRGGDTGRRLPHNSEKEILMPPTKPEETTIAEHYWLVDKKHPAVTSGKLKQGDRVTDQKLTSIMGGGWDQSQQSNATLVIVFDEAAPASASKPKPSKKVK